MSVSKTLHTKYKGKDQTGKKIFTSTVMPIRGAWIEYETDSNDIFYVRVDRTRKIPVTTLLRTIGIVSDVIGSVYMLIMVFLELCTMADEWYVTVPGMIIAAIMIFVLNYYITFRNIDKRTRILLSLIFAIVTAPYTFLVPSRWLYNY